MASSDADRTAWTPPKDTDMSARDDHPKVIRGLSVGVGIRRIAMLEVLTGLLLGAAARVARCRARRLRRRAGPADRDLAGGGAEHRGGRRAGASRLHRNGWPVALCPAVQTRPQTTTSRQILLPGSCLRVSASLLSMLPMFWVHPTRQYTNLNLLVSGLPVSVKAPHAKVRRDGYRQPARRNRKGDST